MHLHGGDMETEQVKAGLVSDKYLEYPRTPWKRSTYQAKRNRGGGPPFYKLGGKVYYDYQEVMNWFKNRENRHHSTSEYQPQKGINGGE